MENTDLTADIDMLCDISLLLHSRKHAWSGMMQTVHQGVHPSKSSIIFVPMIDLSHSKMSFIISTFNYLCDKTGKFNVTPIIAFVQSLFRKAMLIVEYEPTVNYL